MNPNPIFTLLLLSSYVIMCVTFSPVRASSETIDTFNNILGSELQRSMHDKVERLLSVARYPERLMRKLNDSDFETTKQDQGASTISSGNLSPRTVHLDHGIVFEGRKMKGKKYQYMMMRMLMGLKIFIIGLVLPAVIGMALLASWKGMTISLMALLMASIIGMKNLISAATKHEGSHHILVTSIPSQQHQHWWRKSENPEITSWDNPHDLVYRGHR
ncbi:uncharacterized protein LOC120355476 isoform X1 [Nilaparvata lugens]|uniref:uncharacterized protein LOC120355476 isoform X1 n=1 Tax=Nilaparvata lugens TaxID=108931 RepID=UPI00193D4097|nr:uncharacterized protein LOC120355476 isoform X1 [Nilaparvata lugens]